MNTGQGPQKEAESEAEEEQGEGCATPAEAPPTAEELQKMNEEHLDRLKRLQAEFENYKKRAAKEKEECVQLAGARIVKELLGLVDNFDRALADPGTDNGKLARQGLELMRGQLMDILRREGVAEIRTDCKLDPFQHEVISKVDDESREDDAIVECLQKGYKMKGRVIRPARVVVCRKESMNKDENHQDKPFKSDDEDTEVN